MQNPHGCFLPLNALAVHPHGEQKFCLTYNAKKDDQFNFFRRIFDQDRKLIHAQLLKGEWPPGCRSCQNKEDRGVQSRRTRTWERKIARYGKEEVISNLNTQETSKIQHLEITFSNNCNIACAMCSSEFSTSWIKFDKQALEEGLEFRNFTTPFQQRKVLKESTINEILNHANELELVIIKGGEPTIEPLCLDFLKKLNEISDNNKPFVFIQTNGTRDPSQWIPSQVKFPFGVGFSLDGWGEYGEWIRGTNFEKVMSHFDEVSRHPAVQTITVDFTLSLYNVYHLPEFFEKILDLKHLNPKLEECAVFQWVQQNYASPLALNLASRLKVLEKVEKVFNKDPDFFLNFENVLRVLALPQLEKSEVTKAIQWTDYLNKLRQKSIYDIEPEIRRNLYS